MLDNNAALVLDPPDADEVYANYLRTCALLTVEPVSREREQALIEDWNRTLRGESQPTKHFDRTTASPRFV